MFLYFDRRMMIMQIIINSVVCACALAGLIIGLASFFRKRQPLYSQLVTLAIGCAFLGRLYNVVVIICDKEIPRTFNTGVLGTIGCFMFIFSANYGEMDSLCEKKLSGNRKYTFIGFAAPLLLAAEAACILAFSSRSFVLKVTYAAVLAFIMCAAYFNLKHLLIRDVEGGIIKSIRGYNLISLVLEFLYAAEILFDAFDKTKPKSIVYVLMSICLLAIIPVLKKEITSWKVRQRDSFLSGGLNRKSGGAEQ